MTPSPIALTPEEHATYKQAKEYWRLEILSDVSGPIVRELLAIIRRLDARVGELEGNNLRLQQSLTLHKGPHVTMTVSYANELEHAQAQRDALARAVELLQQYVTWTREQNEGPTGLAWTHGWRCSDEAIAEGKRRREEIDAALALARLSGE